MKSAINEKRIAFFLISLFGGGGEKVVLDLAKAFVEDGYEVDLMLFSKKGSLKDSVDSRINIIDLNVSRMILSIFPIINYLRRERPVAVLATSEHANIILLLAKMFSRVNTKILVRVGMTYSDLFNQYKKNRDKLIPLFIRKLYPKAEKVIANSQNVKNDLKTIIGLPEEKIKVIYNPKFISDILNKSKIGEWKLPSKKFTIIAVGRLEKQKDFETLIQSFVQIKKDLDVELIILGDGKERVSLENFIKKYNIQDIYMPGFVSNPYFYLANSDVFVSSSLWEGFSNSMVEASVIGLPIVATDCGSGARELLAPGTDFSDSLKKGNIEYAEYGILIPVQDHESLALVLKKLFEDNTMRNRYSEKSVQRSEAFEVKKILEDYKEIIGVI